MYFVIIATFITVGYVIYLDLVQRFIFNNIAKESWNHETNCRLLPETDSQRTVIYLIDAHSVFELKTSGPFDSGKKMCGPFDSSVPVRSSVPHFFLP